MKEKLIKLLNWMCVEEIKTDEDIKDALFAIRKYAILYFIIIVLLKIIKFNL